MEKKNNTMTILAIGAIVYVLFSAQIKAFLSDFDISKFLPGTSTNEIFPGKPSDAVLGVCAPVGNILKNADKADRLALARLWRETATVIEADTNIITTTAAVRAANNISGQLMFNNGSLKGKYNGLGMAASQGLISYVGNDPKSLDASTRTKIVEYFRGLSWVALNY